MVVRVADLQTDTVEEFRGSPDEVRVELIARFPWSTADNDPARGFLDLIAERIGSAQSFDVGVKFEDEVD